MKKILRIGKFAVATMLTAISAAACAGSVNVYRIPIPGLLANVATTTPPAPDYGVSFSGAGYLTVSKALPDSSNFTVEAWVTVTSAGGVLFCDSTTLSGNDMWVALSPTQAVARGDKTGSVNAVGAGWATIGGIAFNNSTSLGSALHQVIYSAQAGNVSVYIDGALIGTSTATLTNNGSHQLVMGEWSDTGGASNIVDPYYGTISEIRYYNQAMSGTAVASAYAGGITRALGTGTVAAWNFEENGGTTVNDYSGNGYTGILHGTYTWVKVSG